MTKTRQDAWSKNEDIILAETVLRYIREGRTQLEAFKEVAKKLSRTSAACGFRWNATIRKQYSNAIQLARKERKRSNNIQQWSDQTEDHDHGDPLEQAIILLKQLKMKDHHVQHVKIGEEEVIKQLRKENDNLKKKLSRYEDAWEEMGKLWDWIEKTNIK